MFMTAPMGMMQTVQPPLPQTPAFTPQVAPAAQRVLASAVAGTAPAPFANPDRKSMATPPPKSPMIAQPAVTPESMLWKESAAPQTVSSTATTASLLASQQNPRTTFITVPNTAGFAAQLLAQEDMAELALPQNPNVADMMKRIADKKATAALPSPLRTADAPADTIRFATLPANTLNAVMRREMQGSVLVPRGAAAYAQAQQRIRSDAPQMVRDDEAMIEEL